MNRDQIIACYQHEKSIRRTAQIAGISDQKVRKILITAGLYRTEMTDEAKRLRNSGITIEEIAEKLNCKVSAINGMLPYEKGEYLGEKPTQNAIQIRKCRERKKGKSLC